jgi:hypothetical protein
MRARNVVGVRHVADINDGSHDGGVIRPLRR